MKIILTAFALVINLSLAAQNSQLGKVTVEQLKEKIHPLDSTAPASIMAKKGVTRFYLDNDGSWSVETIVDFKIKIYKKNGLQYANYTVPYYTGGKVSETVSFSNTYTYNLVDGKVVKTKLKSEGEFVEKVNENWKQRKITMPAVREGSIIEFSYRHVTPHITKFKDWYFQKEIPVDFVKYEVYIPKYFEYRTVIAGFEEINLESEQLTSSSLGEVKHVYSKVNIPALKDESYVNNLDNYTSILKFELASIRYPGKTPENIALDWEGVVKTIYDDDDFGGQLKKSNYFEEDLKKITAGLLTRDEKITAVFNFVKSKMAFNGKRGFYAENGVKKAYSQSSGNVGDINLILVAMLRAAELEANPVLISTRDNGISLFPSRTAYNYVIAAVEIEDDLILLDATNKNTTFNIIPTDGLNWYGRVIRKEGSSAEVNLMPKVVSKDVISFFAAINPDGSIAGKIREQYFDYNAFLFRENHGALTENAYLEKMEKKYEGIELSDYSVENKSNLEKPIMETYNFTHNSAVEIIGDKMYFSPFFFFAQSANPFRQEKREYPVDFIFPMQDKFIMNIKIPEGYVVESLPKSVIIQFRDDLAGFKMNISANGNQIQMTANRDINTSIFPASYYEDLKLLFTELVKAENQKIILKKA